MKEPKGFNYHEFDGDAELETSGAASATEATGMLPVPPQTEAQLRAYQELGNSIIPKSAPGKKRINEVRRAGHTEAHESDVHTK